MFRHACQRIDRFKASRKRAERTIMRAYHILQRLALYTPQRVTDRFGWIDLLAYKHSLYNVYSEKVDLIVCLSIAGFSRGFVPSSLSHKTITPRDIHLHMPWWDQLQSVLTT
jgi:hypothetical protein